MERHPLFKDENELNFHFSMGERVTATESQFFFEPLFPRPLFILRVSETYGQEDKSKAYHRTLFFSITLN